MNLKKQLHSQCLELVNQRLATIQTTITSNQKALESETKSSAGDKHETGRAMLQLEMEKAGQQLQTVVQMKTVLEKINLESESKTAHLGSLVYTNTMNYFLAVSVGKITIENEDFFAISTNSPIGKLLLGKQENDSILWNRKTITIKRIT